MMNDKSTAQAEIMLDEPDSETRHLLPCPKTINEKIVRSGYLVERLFKTPENNLFNYVKFHLVSQHIQHMSLRCPHIMDIGCGLQVAKRFLAALIDDIEYFGVDYEPTFQPDAVVDLNRPAALDTSMKWNPNVVMLLDVLEHLHDNKEDLQKVLKHVASSMPKDAQLIVTVPQLYRLDRFKLKHLHYPEHKIRLTQQEWHTLINEHFDIKTVQGVGYLSVIPYLPMLSRRYQPGNAFGRLFGHLRSITFEKRWIKPVDLFLSNTLGRLPWFKSISNDILFVATPRNATVK